MAVSILSAGACGGSTSDDSSNSGDASTDAPARFETAPPDDYVPYTRQATLCVPGPYTNPVVAPDASTFDVGDAGDDDAGPSLSLPHVVSSGGSVLAHPVVVPITYLGDPLADQIEDYTSSVGCTDYWRQVASEYGVGQLGMATPVRLTTPPASATVSDNSLQVFIARQITAGAPGFANPPDNVIFAVYLPSGTNVESQGGTSCGTSGASFLGYHANFNYSGREIAYAVIARCNGDMIDDVTNTSSHEFIEASTDPYPFSGAAYEQPDDDHIAFSFGGGGGEVGDLCVNDRNASFRPNGYPFLVQRIWSNASLAAGHAPCVPAVAAPYVAAIPEQPDTVSIQNAEISGPGTTRGVAMAVGQSRTIDIHFHTDTPATTSWTISASDSSRFLEGTTHLTLALDTTTATPDGVAHLTITRNSKSTIYGAEPFSIRATLPDKSNSMSWSGVVGDPQ
ncbi:MAG: hypothetical protein ABI183_16920 [Polyangiaceae bacterium]